MKRDGARLVFSPSDLINFMRSEFTTWMDRFERECPGEAEPDPLSEEDRIVQKKGVEHERAFVNALAGSGRRVTDLSECGAQAGPTLPRCGAATRSSTRDTWRATASPDIPVRVERSPHERCRRGIPLH